ncbi:sortase (surface protein transpeptidase) [Marmoricola sp. URHA0025 HA25]
MPVTPRRTLAAVLVAGALTSMPFLSAPASASTAPANFAVASAAPAAPAARTTRANGEYRITVRGWTRTIVRGNQSTINGCRSATLWEGPLPGGSGTSWLAGHDYCGFYRWDRLLHVGDTFTVSTPSGAILRYVVTGRGFVGRHSGSAAGLIHGDITLQTCRGSGTSFTYARQIGS